MFDRIVLWLFVVFGGIAVGAGFYEMRINVPRWFPRAAAGVRINSEAMIVDDPGRRFWAFVTTLPLTLLTLASLVAAWRPQTAQYRWWLIAAGVMLVERVMTFTYFIPKVVKLMQPQASSSANAAAVAARWVSLNYVRAALALAGWLAALKALSLST
jgi:hypothetical protein